MIKIFRSLFLLMAIQLHSQEIFTRKDSLHGGFPFERTSYDVLRYDLNIAVNIENRTISGFNDITFSATQDTKRIQVDLFENMVVDSIIYNRKALDFNREFNAVFIDFPQSIQLQTTHQIRFYYHGAPIAAKKAPWDGGFDWKTDSSGNPWVCVAVQGTGASLWFPVKDSQSDEPDNGTTIKVAVPNGLMNVSNGRLTGSEDLKNGYTRWDWEVKNPINSYDITLNIGDYVRIQDSLDGLDLEYYVIRGNEVLAGKQFEQVKPMLECFQAKFGTYPFADDSYKLVESTYLGMEHQSAVAYGNRYGNGYLGSDISRTGIGLLFDYIIIHESGHEWFGNSITSRDIADMWIHESFTTYSEAVFVECQFGQDKAITYINGLKNNIANDKPIIAKYGVNDKGSGDMYYKGALMIHTIRGIINDDALFWKIILKFSQTFRHKIIDTKNVIDFFNTESGLNLTPVFNQYLLTAQIPNLKISVKKKTLTYQWENVQPGFDMPVDVEIQSETIRLFPTTQPKNYPISKGESVKVLTDRFLVTTSK